MNWNALRARLPGTEPLVLGAYAWVLTVATPCFEVATGVLTTAVCVISLLLLTSGWAMLTRAPRIADSLGVLGFVVSSAGVLIRLGPQSFGFGSPIVRIMIGATIWCLFAISWARARHLPVVRASAVVPHAILDAATMGAPSPLRSRLIIGSAGIICAIAVVRFGTPSSDGHGVLVVGLIVVGSLHLTSASSVLLARLERARFVQQAKARGQSPD